MNGIVAYGQQFTSRKGIFHLNLKKLMLPTQTIEKLILDHLQRKCPFSLIRINDGENRAIGYKKFVTKKQMPRWFRYTGVEEPDERVKGALIQAIKGADVVGFPTQEHTMFRPLSEKILTYYKLNSKRICNGIVNRVLLKNGGLSRIIKGQRIILVGLTIGEAAPTFQRMGAKIVGIEPVLGFQDIPRVLRQIEKLPDFDLALVSAGIPAKTICVQISRRLGKVALDMGHVPELVLYPDKRYGEVIKDWLAKNPSVSSRKK